MKNLQVPELGGLLCYTNILTGFSRNSAGASTLRAGQFSLKNVMSALLLLDFVPASSRFRSFMGKDFFQSLE
jgi:hypothetical protein